MYNRFHGITIDTEPFQEPDHKGYLLIGPWGDVIPHEDAFEYLESLLIGYESIATEEIYAQNLAVSLGLDKLREDLYKQKSPHFNKKVESGFVYLAAASDGETVKIGASSNPEKRVKSIRTLSGEKVELVHAQEVEYPYYLEFGLHRYFREERLAGEWFHMDMFDLEKAKHIINMWDDRDHKSITRLLMGGSR